MTEWLNNNKQYGPQWSLLPGMWVPCNLLLYCTGLSVLTTEYGRGDDIWFLRWVYEYTMALVCLLSLSLGSFTLEEASFHVMSSPRGKDLVERNWGLWPTARKVLKPTRKSHRREVESRFSRPSQPFRWLQPWPTSWCNLMRDTESELPT